MLDSRDYLPTYGLYCFTCRQYLGTDAYQYLMNKPVYCDKCAAAAQPGESAKEGQP